MAPIILVAFIVKSAITAAAWSGELGDACYKASLHVRAVERRPYTPAEDKLQRFAMKRSAWFVLALPVIGNLCATIWPSIALPEAATSMVPSHFETKSVASARAPRCLMFLSSCSARCTSCMAS